jgi:hypothetical protein
MFCPLAAITRSHNGFVVLSARKSVGGTVLQFEQPQFLRSELRSQIQV